MREIIEMIILILSLIMVFASWRNSVIIRQNVAVSPGDAPDCPSAAQ